MVNSPAIPTIGTGVYMSRYEKDEGVENVPLNRNSSRSPPRRSSSSRSNGLGPNPSPAAVALHQQLIKQRAMKAAAAAAATAAAAAATPFGAFSTTAVGFMDPPGLYQLPSPRASFCSTLDSSGSFATLPSADSFPLSPCNSGSYALSPAALSTLPSSSAFSPALLAPQHQFYAIGGSFSAGVQEVALQQQEAEVDAALLRLINVRQQLAAMRTPPTVPAQALFTAPATNPVSAATVGLADPLAPQAASAPVSPSTAAAQLQLASLQAQQQQLVSAEAQLQAELAAQMVRMLGL